MSRRALRWVSILGLGVVGVMGVYVGGKVRRDTAQRLADLREGIRQSEAVSGRSAVAPSLELDPLRFERGLAQDIEQFGLGLMTERELVQPNAYFVERSSPLTLAVGQTWSSDHLSIEIELDTVAYQQRGTTVSAPHTIARVNNRSDHPLAYQVVLRAETKPGQVRGTREHNAVALMPGESALITVCVGHDNVRVDRVEVLEVTALGYYYLSQVSPLALGAEASIAAAHTPVVPVAACVDLDAKTLVAYQHAGTASWVDVVDFYSRHNCHRLQFFPGYRRVEQTLDHLPAAPPSGRPKP